MKKNFVLKIIKNLFITINMPGRHLFAGRPEQIVYATSFLFPIMKSLFFYHFFLELYR
jgi:hypothetical protein